MTSDDSTYDTTGRLGLQVTLDAAAATVTPHGDIDVVTSPSLLGVLNALIEDGYREIATDLTEVTFIDARGVTALTEIARRLIGAGSTTSTRTAEDGHGVDVRSRSGSSELIVRQSRAHHGE